MSYVAPTIRATGDLITSAIYNADLVADIIAVARRVGSPPWGPGAMNNTSANLAYYIRADVQPGLALSTIELNIGTSSGNLDVGIFADTAGLPGAALWRRGALASPGTGQRSVAISGGTPTSLTLTDAVVWIAIAVDNATIQLPLTTNLPKGLAYSQATAYPLPSSATPVATTSAFHAGVL